MMNSLCASADQLNCLMIIYMNSYAFKFHFSEPEQVGLGTTGYVYKASMYLSTPNDISKCLYELSAYLTEHQ